VVVVLVVFILEEKLEVIHLHPFQRIDRFVRWVVLDTKVIDMIQLPHLFPLQKG